MFPLAAVEAQRERESVGEVIRSSGREAIGLAVIPLARSGRIRIESRNFTECQFYAFQSFSFNRSAMLAPYVPDHASSAWGTVVIKPAAVAISASPATGVVRPASARESARVYSLTPLRPRVLFVTSEMSDFVQVGGLGAVSAALPRALKRHGDVRVMLPGYRQVLEPVAGDGNRRALARRGRRPSLLDRHDHARRRPDRLCRAVRGAVQTRRLPLRRRGRRRLFRQRPALRAPESGRRAMGRARPLRLEARQPAPERLADGAGGRLSRLERRRRASAADHPQSRASGSVRRLAHGALWPFPRTRSPCRASSSSAASPSSRRG